MNRCCHRCAFRFRKTFVAGVEDRFNRKVGIVRPARINFWCEREVHCLIARGARCNTWPGRPAAAIGFAKPSSSRTAKMETVETACLDCQRSLRAKDSTAALKGIRRSHRPDSRSVHRLRLRYSAREASASPSPLAATCGAGGLQREPLPHRLSGHQITIGNERAQIKARPSVRHYYRKVFFVSSRVDEGSSLPSATVAWFALLQLCPLGTRPRKTYIYRQYPPSEGSFSSSRNIRIANVVSLPTISSLSSPSLKGQIAMTLFAFAAFFLPTPCTGRHQ